MSDFALWLTLIGAVAFGLVVGWVTYRTLRRVQSSTGLSDIATIIGAIGGAAVTALFPKETGAFGAYCIGLAVGFFGYALVAFRPGAPDWLGEPRVTPAGLVGGAQHPAIEEAVSPRPVPRDAR